MATATSFYPSFDDFTGQFTATPYWSKIDDPYSTPDDGDYIYEVSSAVASFSVGLSATILDGRIPKSCGFTTTCGACN